MKYKCGHESKPVFIKNDSLSIIHWNQWKNTTGFDGDKTECHVCYAKRARKLKQNELVELKYLGIAPPVYGKAVLVYETTFWKERANHFLGALIEKSRMDAWFVERGTEGLRNAYPEVYAQVDKERNGNMGVQPFDRAYIQHGSKLLKISAGEKEETV